MKNILITIFISFFLLSTSSAQVYVGGEDIQTNNEIHFIKIFLTGSFLNNNYNCWVDYGQKRAMLARATSYLTKGTANEEREDFKTFNSDISMLNWFYAQGWDLVHVVHKETGGESTNSTLIYVMRRKRNTK